MCINLYIRLKLQFQESAAKEMSASSGSTPSKGDNGNNNNDDDNNNENDEMKEEGESRKRKAKSIDLTPSASSLSSLSSPQYKIDIRSTGVGRSMDLFMYVLYSEDEVFIQNIVNKVVREVVVEEECAEMDDILLHVDNRLMYKCLFFVMVDFHAKFRYWALSDNANMGLQPMCPHKALRFLKSLREEIVPSFLVNETMRMDDLERKLKVEYIRS